MMTACSKRNVTPPNLNLCLSEARTLSQGATGSTCVLGDGVKTFEISVFAGRLMATRPRFTRWRMQSQLTLGA